MNMVLGTQGRPVESGFEWDMEKVHRGGPDGVLKLNIADGEEQERWIEKVGGIGLWEIGCM